MRIYRYVGSFLLGAALIAPAGMLASTNFQDDHHQDDKNRGSGRKKPRGGTTIRITRTTTIGMIAKITRTSNGRPKIIATTVTSPISNARSSRNTGTGGTTTQTTTGTGTSSNFPKIR